MKMKYISIIILLFFAVNAGSAQQIAQKKQTEGQLAVSYYNAKDYEKAIPLLQKVYKNTGNKYYYRLYVSSLLETKQYVEAEKDLTREINIQKTPNPELLVYLGHVLDMQEREEEATLKFEEAIAVVPENKGSFILAANAFLRWGEYEYAAKTYLRGREIVPQVQFNYELARAYYYLRNYKSMMEEYLNLLRGDEKQLPRVQSSLSSAMRLDIDNGLRDQFRGQVLKRIQSEPGITGYNRLLIWFFLQEKKFSSALRQSVALDRRTGEEAPQIMQLGQMALRNKNYDNAKKAYEYLLDKGEESPFYKNVFAQNIHVNYLQFTTETPDDRTKGNELEKQFEEGLNYLGVHSGTLSLLQQHAHLLAFYLNNSEKAIEKLQKGLETPRLKPDETGLLKTEMADIYVYAGDPWEATLIYSQVIDANKKNSLGDDVKLKKAKLGYYTGNFSWAKAQLDVLKASTSKLTANDALDLSLLIGNNLNLDTTAVPLTMFAKADLLFFRNKDSLALVTLDSLSEMFPYHTLVDDILYRKAKIETGKQNYIAAANYLEQIVNDFSYEILGDDALFELADLYNYHLNEKEKASDLYKEMLFNYPGSIYVEESRKNYRELREVYPDNEILEEQLSPEFEEIESGEFE